MKIEIFINFINNYRIKYFLFKHFKIYLSHNYYDLIL